MLSPIFTSEETPNAATMTATLNVVYCIEDGVEGAREQRGLSQPPLYSCVNHGGMMLSLGGCHTLRSWGKPLAK